MNHPNPGEPRRIVRLCFTLLLYGFLLGTPIVFYWFFVPIINQAHKHNVWVQDITIYQLREKNKARFQGYDPQAPLADQKAFLLGKLGDVTRFGSDVWVAFCAGADKLLMRNGELKTAPT